MYVVVCKQKLYESLYDNYINLLVGCSETSMGVAVKAAAATVAGKEALAMEAFASALLALPTCIADNLGLDASQLVSILKAKHAQGERTVGIDADEGSVACMRKKGVSESFQVKRQVLLSAAEAAEMVLRIDDIIKSAPRKRTTDRGYC